jgi:hypothetical protein
MARASGWTYAAALGLALVGSPHAAQADGDATSGATPVADDATLIALAVALACAEPLVATAAAEPSPAATVPAPEIELVATVRARSLRFDEIPRLDAILRGGGAGRRTSWKAERVNLPLRPEPGTVYRDVQVRLTVVTDPDGLGTLLREAKRAARGIRLEDAPPTTGPPAGAPIAAPVLVGDPAPRAAPPRTDALPPPPPAAPQGAANGALPPPPPPPPAPGDAAPSR